MAGLAGLYYFRDGWHHRVWFNLMVMLPMWACQARAARQVLRLSSPAGLALAVAAASGLLAGLAGGWPGGPAARTFAYDLLLLATWLAVPAVATGLDPRFPRRLLAWIFWSAAATTLASIVWYHAVQGLPFGGRRLRNVLVYADGLNPVLTGLACGFAALAGLPMLAQARGWRRRICLAATALLLLGVFLTNSRGALLALAAGLGAAALARPWREWGPHLALTLLAGLAYFQFRPGAASGLVERADTGRFEIYQTFLDRIGGLREWLFGKGPWTSTSLPEEILGWFVDHPHSALMSMLVTGGLLGLAGWLLVALSGLWRAWRLARRPPPGVQPALAAAPWILLAFGLAGTTFDAGPPLSLLGVARIEPLVLALPLALLAAVPRAAKAEAPEQP
jgi:hypothetical protein